MNIYIVIGAVVVFVLFVLAGLSVVNYSSEELFSKYKEISKHRFDFSALQLADFANRKYFGGAIRFQKTDKLLADSFKSDFTLTLCKEYALSNNLAGVAICAHELGHAMQYKTNAKKMNKYSQKVRASKVLSKFITPLMLGAVATACFNLWYVAVGMVLFAVVLFLVALFVKMSTVNIEKEASNNALLILQDLTNIQDFELRQVKQFLNSAKLTYVADVLRSCLRWTGLISK